MGIFPAILLSGLFAALPLFNHYSPQLVTHNNTSGNQKTSQTSTAQTVAIALPLQSSLNLEQLESAGRSSRQANTTSAIGITLTSRLTNADTPDKPITRKAPPASFSQHLPHQHHSSPVPEPVQRYIDSQRLPLHQLDIRTRDDGQRELRHQGQFHTVSYASVNKHGQLELGEQQILPLASHD